MYSVNILSIEFKCSFEYQLMTELTIGEVLSVYDLISRVVHGAFICSRRLYRDMKTDHI